MNCLVGLKREWEGGKVEFATWSWKKEVKVAMKSLKRGFLLGPFIQSQSYNPAAKWLWILYKCM